jgi:ACR3 family arsenite transporter
VGVLIEVPVMLSLVKIVNSSRAWYDRGDAVQKRVSAEKACVQSEVSTATEP